MDLSKTFDCLLQDILLAKLQAFKFSKGIVDLLVSCLTNHTQRIKLDSTFSDWRDVVREIPQGSLIGHLLF